MRLRRFLLPVALFVLAGVIGVIAVADHRWKQRRMNRVEVGEWYCVHFGTRCPRPSSATIERRWNDRQLAYEIAVAAIGGAAVFVAARRAVRR
ncbi:MAG TPA: hypothetical protein VGK79_08565 [Gaiellaceae bacterium]